MKLADCKIGMIVCLKADAHFASSKQGNNIGHIIDLVLPWDCFHGLYRDKYNTGRLLMAPPNTEGHHGRHLVYRHDDRPKDVVFPVVKFVGGVLNYITDYEDIEPFTAY